MTFEIQYAEPAKKDRPKLSKKVQEQVERDIEKKLTTFPEVFGKPLKQSLKGYKSLRVGDYRVIYRIGKNTVKIFKIGHRSTIYKTAKKHVLKSFSR